MRRALHIIILVLGLAAVLLAASASDSGADLLYTLPAALCGCGLMAFGIHGCRRETPEDRRAQNRADYRAGWRAAERAAGTAGRQSEANDGNP